uniref:Uncharacterized protein n=1 Tax=Oryza nivara TaxID=4536 RepID=A0A0E0GNJ4_ORYNI
MASASNPRAPFSSSRRPPLQPLAQNIIAVVLARKREAVAAASAFIHVDICACSEVSHMRAMAFEAIPIAFLLHLICLAVSNTKDGTEPEKDGKNLGKAMAGRAKRLGSIDSVAVGRRRHNFYSAFTPSMQLLLPSSLSREGIEATPPPPVITAIAVITQLFSRQVLVAARHVPPVSSLHTVLERWGRV